MQAAGGFEGNTGDQRLPRGNTAQHPASMVAEEALGSDLIAKGRALGVDTAEAVADFHALDGVDTHERMSEIRIQAVKHRLPKSRRNAGRHHVHPRADGIALLAQGVHVILKLRHPRRLGTEKRIVIDRVQIHRIEHDGSKLRQIAANADADAGLQIVTGYGAAGDANGGLAGR